MRRILALFVALALVIAVTGCAKIAMESKVKKPVSMTRMRNVEVREFTTKNRAIWLFWGLFPLSVPKLDQTVGPNVADHNGIQNLKITTENTFLDVVISTVTQGILVMRTITIEGEIYD